MRTTPEGKVPRKAREPLTKPSHSPSVSASRRRAERTAGGTRREISRDDNYPRVHFVGVCVCETHASVPMTIGAEYRMWSMGGNAFGNPAACLNRVIHRGRVPALCRAGVEEMREENATNSGTESEAEGREGQRRTKRQQQQRQRQSSPSLSPRSITRVYAPTRTNTLAACILPTPASSFSFSSRVGLPPRAQDSRLPRVYASTHFCGATASPPGATLPLDHPAVLRGRFCRGTTRLAALS